MNVQNIMESAVESEVNKLYEQVKSEKAAWLTCDCSYCRLDTICYVLNRVPAKYVVSSRGITHSAWEWDNHQIQADLTSIALEGMKIVSRTKRPYHAENNKIIQDKELDKPAFNFATFIGAIIDGSTFEPIPEATVLLSCNGKPAEMIDKSWSNPYKTCKATNGTYSFWVKPVSAKKGGESKTFKFTLDISAEGYTPYKYNFEIPVNSDDVTKLEIDSKFSLKFNDIVLFKEGIINEMDD